MTKREDILQELEELCHALRTRPAAMDRVLVALSTDSSSFPDPFYSSPGRVEQALDELAAEAGISRQSLLALARLAAVHGARRG